MIRWLVKILYFFDIPVYRISPEAYQAILEAKHAGLETDVHHRFLKANLALPVHDRALIDSLGGSWMYNEIVGYIRLHLIGSQIRGEYFEKSNLRVSRKVQFKYKTHKLAPELELPLTKKNADIYSVILQYLQSCKHELPKKRYLDTSIVETIGSLVNWKKLFTALLIV